MVDNILMQYPRWPEEGIQRSRTGLKDGCDQLCVYRTLKLGHLEEQKIPSTSAISLAPLPGGLKILFFCGIISVLHLQILIFFLLLYLMLSICFCKGVIEFFNSILISYYLCLDDETSAFLLLSSNECPVLESRLFNSRSMYTL